MSGYASLPPSSGVDRARVDRATRDLRGVVARVERVLADRGFRLRLLAVLNVLDVLTTTVVLSLGGTESNPALQGVVEHWWKPLAIKAMVLAAMWAVVLRTPLRSRVADIGLVLAWTFYAGVVGWNTLLLIGA